MGLAQVSVATKSSENYRETRKHSKSDEDLVPMLPASSMGLLAFFGTGTLDANNVEPISPRSRVSSCSGFSDVTAKTSRSGADWSARRVSKASSAFNSEK